MNNEYVLQATQYALDIIEGKIPANKYVKLACQRQIDDLQREDFRYEFDQDKAGRICKFIEMLPHTKGRWAAKKEKIKLQPWQMFLLTTLFGWVDKKTGKRRFLEAYNKIPRKNGKSILAAGIGVYCLVADGEYGAEVYSGATTEKQAWEVFKPARLMCLRTPELTEYYGLSVNASNLNIPEDESKLEPMIGNPGDGSSPSCAIIDEYHEHKTPDMYNTMLTGMGAREQPLLFMITTAGSDISGPCYDKEEEAIRVLEGVYENEQLFAIMYGIDEGDDWADPETLRKANPNIGISISEEFLLARQREAIASAAKQNAFKTKHLNVWVSARTAWMNMQDWKACADENLNIDDWVGESFYSLDLASKCDIAASGKLFRKTIKGSVHYAWFPSFYLPESAINEDKTGKYKKWVAQGHLIVTDGNEIDFDVIKEDVLNDATKYGCNEMPYDPWRATKLAQELAKEDIQVIEYHASTKNMSEPMYELEAAIKSRRLHHDNNPVMTWMMSNVTVKPDAKDNIYPRKEKPEYKIDGPVALIMSMGRAMLSEEDSSAYDDRGVLSF